MRLLWEFWKSNSPKVVKQFESNSFREWWEDWWNSTMLSTNPEATLCQHRNAVVNVLLLKLATRAELHHMYIVRELVNCKSTTIVFQITLILRICIYRPVSPIYAVPHEQIILLTLTKNSNSMVISTILWTGRWRSPFVPERLYMSHQ